MAVEESVATSTAENGKRVISLEDCKQHADVKDCWLVVHGKVYDVTDFLDEHPGGFDIIIAATGKDATEDFEEVGHSAAARDMLDEYYIGEFAGGDSAPPKKLQAASTSASSSGSPLSTLIKALLPFLILLAAVALGFYLKN